MLMKSKKTAPSPVKNVADKQEPMSADDKVKARLDEQRKLNESGSCCGACGG